MLPYNWPHPASWNIPDPRYNHSYTSVSSHSLKYSDRNCCPQHNEGHIQKRLEIVELRLKSIMNHLAKQGLQDPLSLPNASSTPLAAQTPQLLNRTTDTSMIRKRKAMSDKDSNKCTTIMKRKKLIQDLEQQVAAERADNQKMEERIGEMRKQLAALRSKRHEITQKRLSRELDQVSEVGDIDSEADSDDEYESDVEENEKEQDKEKEDGQLG